MSSGEALTFSFQVHELATQLSRYSQDPLTGYWQISLSPQPGSASAPTWYLALVQRRVIVSDHQKLSWPALLTNLERYVPRLRISWSKTALEVLDKQLEPAEKRSLATMLDTLEKMALLRPGEAVQALRTQIMTHLDAYLFDRSGQASFLNDPDLVSMAPISGFDLDTLLMEAATRQDQWNALRAQIPTMTKIPAVNLKVVEKFRLSEDQQRRLQKMTETGKSLEAIAEDMGKDSLEVARIFANWIRMGLVELQGSDPAPVHPPSSTIVAIDDSVVIQELIRRTLPQYHVLTTGSAAEGLSLIFRHKPDLIVLDLTMPELDGLEVCRTIRSMPYFKQTPIVMLTARDGLVDKLKGKLAGATIYLTKPFNADEFRRVTAQYLASGSLNPQSNSQATIQPNPQPKFSSNAYG